MINKLICPMCDMDEAHLLTSIEFRDDDNYFLTEFTVDGKYNLSISRKIPYPYRSQKSIQLLFTCEEGHYFHKSFNGHKGVIMVDDNPIMDKLCEYLNSVRHTDFVHWDFDFALLGRIEEFFKTYS